MCGSHLAAVMHAGTDCHASICQLSGTNELTVMQACTNCHAQMRQLFMHACTNCHASMHQLSCTDALTVMQACTDCHSQMRQIACTHALNAMHTRTNNLAAFMHAAAATVAQKSEQVCHTDTQPKCSHERLQTS